MKKWLIFGTPFIIPRHYTVLEPMGAGAYGLVVAAKNEELEDEENNLVAIKKIENLSEHKIFMQRTLRELIILRVLKHENIMNIQTIVKPSHIENFTDLYLVSELMETDLNDLIKSD